MDFNPNLKNKTPIVHVITTIMRGGAENQLLILVAQQVESGHPVHIIFLKGESELSKDFKRCGASVHEVFANRNPLVQVFSIRKFLRTPEIKPALIHGHLPRAQIIVALAVAKTQVFVCSRHDEDQFFPGSNKFFSRLIFKIVDSKTKIWIAISNSVKFKMLSYDEIPHFQNIEVAHYGYKESETEIDESLVGDLKRTYKLEGNYFVIGCVARLVWQKDHSTLLRSFQIYKLNNPSAKLILIGDGPMRQQLTELSAKLGITDSVVFTGKVSSVREHLRLLNVFVLPSQTEGFGLVLLEAMDAKLPIIASDISAIPEVVGESGLLFEGGNELDLSEKIQKLETQEVQEIYSALSRNRLTEFAPEIMWSRIRDIYQKAAQYL